MDPKESKANSTLNEIREQNAERWAKLKSLYSQHKDQDKISVETALVHDMTKIDDSQNLIEDVFDSEPNPQEFCREVVRSYDELVQTRTVLEQQLRHNKDKIKAMNDIMNQHDEIKQNLLQSEKVSNKGRSETNSKLLTLEQELEWLHEELSYVTRNIEGTKDDTFWSLEKIIKQLLELYFTSPSDPYLLADSLPVNPSHIELLKRCSIIQSHEHNQNLICLTSYLPGNLEI
mmetsp:Transcript_30791/g.46707  ORF Transcript_30791/g.46707 Transcript_30791/m.46707 type:complete len:232 (+) Transcript_30791:98-793(+)